MLTTASELQLEIDAEGIIYSSSASLLMAIAPLPNIPAKLEAITETNSATEIALLFSSGLDSSLSPYSIPKGIYNLTIVTPESGNELAQLNDLEGQVIAEIPARMTRDNSSDNDETSQAPSFVETGIRIGRVSNNELNIENTFIEIRFSTEERNLQVSSLPIGND